MLTVSTEERTADGVWCYPLSPHTLARPSNSLCSGSKGNAPVFYSHQANSDAVNIGGYYWSRPSHRKPSQQGRGSQPFHNNVYVVNKTRVPLQICFLDVTDWGQTSEAVTWAQRYYCTWLYNMNYFPANELHGLLSHVYYSIEKE